MPGKIPVGDLDAETKAKLGLGNHAVSVKVTTLGKVLLDLQGLTNREALWVLRTAVFHIKGYRRKGERA